MTLSGKDLIAALTNQPFALLRVFGDGPEPIAVVTPEQVMALLHSREVVAIGSKTRVRYLQKAHTGHLRIPAPRGLRKECWLNTQAAVIRFWDDQQSARGVRVSEA